MASKLRRTASADLIQPRAASTNSNFKYAESVAGILLQIENQSQTTRMKPKKESKNFARINLARIREIQKLCRQSNETKNAPVKPSHSKTNELYRDVPSRLSEYLNTRTLPSVRDASSRSSDFDGNGHAINSSNCRICSNTSSAVSHLNLTNQIDADVENDVQVLQNRNLNKEEMISTNKTLQEIPQLHLPFHATSAKAQSKTPTLRSTSVHIKPLLSTTKTHLQDSTIKTSLSLPANYKLGSVPKYLQDRQKSWLEEEKKRKAEIEDSNIPAGHELVSEKDRIETLEKLKNNYSEILKHMSLLPIRMDTLRIQHQKAALEKQLVKIEEAIKIFSQPKVFIKKNT